MIEQYDLHIIRFNNICSPTSQIEAPTSFVFDFTKLTPGLEPTLCVSYLCFSDFETQVTKLPPKRKFEREGLLESEGPLGIPSILGLHRSLLQIPYRLLGGKPAIKAPEIDYTNHVTVPGNPSANASVNIKDKYKLLDYVINHWEPHTRHSVKTESEKAIQDLAMYKTLPFEFRPWGENEHFGAVWVQFLYEVIERPSKDYATAIHFSFQLRYSGW